MSSPNPVRGNSVFLVLLLFFQLLLMSGSVKGRDGVSRLEAAVVVLTSPVTTVAAWTGSGVRSLFLGIRGTLVARRENLRFRQTLEDMTAELDRLKELEPENARLRALLSMREGMAPESIGASIIGASLSTEARLIIIDRGSGSGVRENQAVVAWGGAVGRVVSVAPGFAKVRLLSDPNSGVAAVIRHNRVDGMVLGEGGDSLSLTMKYVSGFADVSLGDVVVTSGLDGIFPRGFRIGEVTFVGTGGEVSREIHVSPSCRIEDLEDVLVLTGRTAGGLLPALDPEADR
jgi:rod shape-determining protein MreC